MSLPTYLQKLNEIHSKFKIMGSKYVLINLLATIWDFDPIIKKDKLPKVPLGLYCPSGFW